MQIQDSQLILNQLQYVWCVCVCVWESVSCCSSAPASPQRDFTRWLPSLIYCCSFLNIRFYLVDSSAAFELKRFFLFFSLPVRQEYHCVGILNELTECKHVRVYTRRQLRVWRTLQGRWKSCKTRARQHGLKVILIYVKTLSQHSILIFGNHLQILRLGDKIWYHKTRKRQLLCQITIQENIYSHMSP